MDASHEILDAFIDGETVDPAALKRALSDPAGRDYLIDAWLLRGIVQDEIASETAQPQSRGGSPVRSWLIAASLAGVCLIGGYVVGARFAGVIVPAPAPATSSGTETVAPAPPPSSTVPAATRVIRLELDPNWKESAGGR
jgi:hypothetical protein